MEQKSKPHQQRTEVESNARTKVGKQDWDNSKKVNPTYGTKPEDKTWETK